MTIGFDILGGFNTRAAEEREVIRQQQAQRDQTELKILEALANSPDPEIRDRAIAGMLNFADPRKKRKGLSGFLGETEGHPALPAIAALLGPQGMNIDPGEVRTGLPGFSQTPTAGAPGGQVRTPPAPAGQAAGAATSPTQGGPIALPTGIGQVGQAMPMPAAAAPPAPPPPTSTGQVAAQAPPAQVGLPTPPPSFADTRKAPRGASVSVKRREAFLQPEEAALRQSRAKAQGDVEGEVAGLIAAGFTDEEARALVKETYERRARLGAGRGISAAGQSYAEGEIIPDESSPTGYSQILYLRADPTQQQKIPAPKPTARSSRTVNSTESVAYELFGTPGEDPRAVMTRLTPEEMAQVNATVQQRNIDLRYNTTAAAGQARNEAALNAPLDPNTLGVQGLPAGSTLATFAGIVPISADQRNRIDAAKALAPQIDQMDALIQRVFPPSAGLTGGLTAAAVLAQKKAQRDPEIEQLEALVNLSIGNVARVLAAESGRLTEQDAIRARSALVDLKVSLLNGDTQETAIAKVRVVQDALRRIGMDLKSPGQILGTERPIPTPGGRPPAGPPTPPPAQGAPGAAGGTPTYAIGQVVYGADGRRGVIRQVLADGQLVIAWEGR